jgi:glycolate oxidase iron-sulfur subunit
VRYRELLVPFRARAEQHARSRVAHMLRAALLATLESPGAFRVAVAAARVTRWLTPALPTTLRAMLALVPSRLPASQPLASFNPAVGPRRARVALLAGCVQRVLRPSINAATVRVLRANGVEVVIPAQQGCCGALASHSGFLARGQELAVRNAAAFPTDVDAIITTAAGCGSAMKEGAYRTPVHDVAEFLDTLGICTPLAFDTPTTVAYHDACHLSHGQGIRAAPRRLLSQIRNLVLVEVQDEEMCCGSAGLYNLEQPAIATDLGRRKAAAIRATGAQMVATGNIGCLTQIEAHGNIRAHHTIEVLNSALHTVE